MKHQTPATLHGEEEITHHLANLNSAELQILAQRCEAKGHAWLRNAQIVKAWLEGSSNDMAN